MALPIPARPVNVPVFTEVIAGVSTNKLGSSLDGPYAWEILNDCDVAAYIGFRGSLNINTATAECDVINQAGLSIKGRLPIDATDADVDTLLNFMRDELKKVIPIT